jgi:hypothetical protein
VDASTVCGACHRRKCFAAVAVLCHSVARTDNNGLGWWRTPWSESLWLCHEQKKFCRPPPLFFRNWGHSSATRALRLVVVIVAPAISVLGPRVSPFRGIQGPSGLRVGVPSALSRTPTPSLGPYLNLACQRCFGSLPLGLRRSMLTPLLRRYCSLFWDLETVDMRGLGTKR